MEILNNAWFVGIGGGILSGLFVALITRALFSKKDNREYAQKVLTVNKEVVYALRPGISEGHIPSEDVLSSLVNATARKYKIEKSDVYQPRQIAEELIKEIMDSSFISTETKKQYCEILAHLVSEAKPDILESEMGIGKSILVSEYRRSQNERMSFILGLTAAMGTMLMALTKFTDAERISSPIKNLLDLTVPTLIILLAAIVSTASMLAIVKIKQVNKRNALR